MAVAKFELILARPIFINIAVSAANIDDSRAIENIHKKVLLIISVHI